MTKTQDNGEATYDGISIDMVCILGTGGNNSGIKWNSNDMLNDAMYQYFYVDPSAYESDGGGGGIPDIPWPESTHNKMIDVALRKLTAIQQELVKKGSENADQLLYQLPKYSYMHAVRSSETELVEIAIRNMKNYFIEQATLFKANHDFVILGMALHPIMDAYSSPHSGFKLYDAGRNGAIWSHFPELLYLPNSIDVINAERAIYGVYSQLAQYSNGANNAQIGAIFDNWLGGYLKYLRNQ